VEAKLMILEELSVYCSSVLMDCHYFLDVWDDLLEIFALEGMSWFRH
jgi:tagatose-1,6-bisphosphate aldolase